MTDCHSSIETNPGAQPPKKKRADGERFYAALDKFVPNYAHNFSLVEGCNCQPSHDDRAGEIISMGLLHDSLAGVRGEAVKSACSPLLAYNLLFVSVASPIQAPPLIIPNFSPPWLFQRHLTSLQVFSRLVLMQIDAPLRISLLTYGLEMIYQQSCSYPSSSFLERAFPGPSNHVYV